MNTTTPHGGIVGVVVPLSIFRIQTNVPNEPNSWAQGRVMEIEDSAIKMISTVDDARRTIAATRIAYEKLRKIITAKHGQVWGFPIYADEVEDLARAEKLCGVGHAQAEQELARLACLPCKPFADEIVSGLFKAVRWLGHPATIVRFGFSRDQGWCL